MIAKSFEEIISYQQLELDVVAGTATAGIPHAAILATHLEKPMCYVRASAKSHGRNNIIEGPSVEGRNVILIEDLISTGMSSLKAVEAIQEAGGTVNAVLAIFSYGFPFADSAFQDAGIPFFVLTNYETLLEAAVAAGSIREDELELLRSWRTNPQKWGDMIRER